MTYWIRQHWKNVERRYHTDKDCFTLQRADGEPQQATECEVEAWSLCQWCAGDVDHSQSGTDLFRRLQEMDAEDVIADAAGGES